MRMSRDGYFSPEQTKTITSSAPDPPPSPGCLENLGERDTEGEVEDGLDTIKVQWLQNYHLNSPIEKCHTTMLHLMKRADEMVTIWNSLLGVAIELIQLSNNIIIALIQAIPFGMFTADK
ncbi:hypothetical protein CDAR_498711 [Caerostris darwini]|uniref:Uncharacterized protein n=1 Tax=Caerostris darwini TaxID=1538125 RepID=A0AAV4SPX0_9ARAC|nr:hypothetical protein CDAR_498711 [Caerostris darwini]